MIRNYQNSDYDTLIVLYKNKAIYGGNYDPVRDEASRLLKTADAGNLLVCEIDGMVVGSVMILDNPHTFWLLRFVVDQDGGHGDETTREIDWAVRKIAKDRGHKSIIVYTDPEDEQLLDRYRSLGYIESSNYRCFWKGVES